jgi:serine phosphatase RsbU (regulator of sigma subunit)
MSGVPDSSGIGLEVLAPDRTCRFVRIMDSPFLIGRGSEAAKHLQLPEQRVSRHCAAITLESGEYYLEDQGQRSGLFVNGERVKRCRLQLGDVITFGFDNFYELRFRTPEPDTSIPDLLNKIEDISSSAEESGLHNKRGELLGAVYLDSCRPVAHSNLDRRILDVLGVEATSILENARLVERDRQRRRLEQEIEIARQIQRALLPRSFRDFPNLDVSGISIPCLSIGGDYFDVFSMDGNRTAFLIADVAGKGHGAALLAAMLRGALLGITIGSDPARVIEHINRYLCEHPDVERYATVFFGILSRDGEIEFVNAGHPSPILLQCGEISEPFVERSFPVGLMPEATYGAARIQLQPGDTLVLYSDGVTEAADPEQQLFGITRLRRAVDGMHDNPLEQIQDSVLRCVNEFSRGAGQADDITLLLVRYSPSSAS